MRFKTEKEITEIVRKFEDASIARNDWGHVEHLVVALHYVDTDDLETATAKMRDGIFNLLRNGFNVDLENEMPYHETLTVFWMQTVAEFVSNRSSLSLLDRANELADLYDKDFPLNFYTREILFSDEARTKFIEPTDSACDA